MRKREKLVLGIETVTKIGSLAIVEDGKVLAHATIDTQLRHNAKLISCLNDLLKGLSVDISEISIIAVDIGPGSFTGIRVGLSTALGLARADNKQLVGVRSLEVLYNKVREKGIPSNTEFVTAREYLAPTLRWDGDEGAILDSTANAVNSSRNKIPRSKLVGYFIIPAIDAKKGLYYSAIYGLDGKEIKKPYLVSKENLPQGFLFGPEIDNTYPDAGHVAIIGWEKIKEGFVQKNIEPMYLHDIELNIK